MFKLLSGVAPFYRPDDGNGSGGNDAPVVDSVRSDVEAAFDELESGGGDGGAEGLGGREPSETAEPAERAGQARRDGQQAKEGDEAGDRGDGRTKRGQFAAKPGDKPAGDKPAQGDKSVLDAAARAADDAARAAADPNAATLGTVPPLGFSPHSKAQWENFRRAFPTIAADIARRETETNQGLAALRDFKDLKPYAEMAQRSNTTLSAALHRFTSLETLARRSPSHGLVSVCSSLGMPKAEALEALQRAAQLIGGDIQIPSAHQPAGDPANGGARPGDQKPDPLLSALAPIFKPILDELGTLRKYVADASSANQTALESTLDNAIVTFASDPKNVFFEHVEEVITNLFASKLVPLTGNHAADLRTAYDLACRMHPEVNEALIEQRLGTTGAAKAKRDQDIADRARRAGRSLAGSSSPDIVSDPPPRRHDGVKPLDAERRSDVESAYEQVAGSVSY
jgi:hypothetical protein